MKSYLDGWHWPFQRYSGSNAEYACPHGIGHSIAEVHGCDGCCSHKSFQYRFDEVLNGLIFDDLEDGVNDG